MIISISLKKRHLLKEGRISAIRSAYKTAYKNFVKFEISGPFNIIVVVLKRSLHVFRAIKNLENSCISSISKKLGIFAMKN